MVHYTTVNTLLNWYVFFIIPIEIQLTCHVINRATFKYNIPFKHVFTIELSGNVVDPPVTNLLEIPE